MNRIICKSISVLVILFLSCKENSGVKSSNGVMDSVSNSPDGLIKSYDQNNKIKNITNYKLGKKNGESINYFANGVAITKELYSLRGHDFIIDTLLSLPPNGWSYYISRHIQDKAGKYDKVFLEQVIFKE